MWQVYWHVQGQGTIMYISSGGKGGGGRGEGIGEGEAGGEGGKGGGTAKKQASLRQQPTEGCHMRISALGAVCFTQFDREVQSLRTE